MLFEFDLSSNVFKLSNFEILKISSIIKLKITYELIHLIKLMGCATYPSTN